MLHRFFLQRSTEARKAKLYFIPVYTGRFYHTLLLNENLSHWDSVRKVSELVLEAINWVKSSRPYWNSTNGLDHFMVFSMDMGRCHSLAGLSADSFGDLFAIQPAGDIAIKDFETRTWACYRQGRDIVIPVYPEEALSMSDVVAPHWNERPISVLYRFGEGGRGDYGLIRTALLHEHEQNPIENSTAGWADARQTQLDMSHSVFCVCPPGIAQHTLRITNAIVRGCIPVTFLLGNDSPFERLTGLPYSKFSVNIHPEETKLMQPLLRRMLAKPEVIAEMQAALHLVQQRFVWDKDGSQGVFEGVYEELQHHPMAVLS